MIIDTYNAVANTEEADRLSERIEMLGKKTKADNKDIIRPTRNLSHELEVFLQAKKFGKVDETVLQKDGIIVK